MTTATKEQLATWTEDNPLRRWRSLTGTSILDAAVMLGASMTSVRLWEKGVHVPGPDHLAHIAEVTENAALADEWQSWKNRQPGTPGR